MDLQDVAPSYDLEVADLIAWTNTAYINYQRGLQLLLQRFRRLRGEACVDEIGGEIHGRWVCSIFIHGTRG